MKCINFTILLTLIFSLVAKAQTEEDNAILSKLDEVKINKIVKPNSAWFITESKEKIKYESFKGQWLLIDFWSTGCVPCIKEFPALAEFSKMNKDRINVIAVSVDNGFKRYVKSARKYAIEIPHYYAGFTYRNAIFNLNIRVFRTTEGSYRFKTLTPQYVLIDPNGKIVDKNLPKPSSKEFINIIDKYICE